MFAEEVQVVLICNTWEALWHGCLVTKQSPYWVPNIYGMLTNILDNKGYPLFFQMVHDITFKKGETTLNVGIVVWS